MTSLPHGRVRSAKRILDRAWVAAQYRQARSTLARAGHDAERRKGEATPPPTSGGPLGVMGRRQ